METHTYPSSKCRQKWGANRQKKIYKTAERCKQTQNPEPLKNLQQGSFKTPEIKTKGDK